MVFIKNIHCNIVSAVGSSNSNPLVDLTPECWFRDDHGYTMKFLILYTDDMEVSLKMLSEVRHNRPHLVHNKVYPILMKDIW